MGTKQAENKGLSPKRQRFVEEYLKDCNASQAAIRAGYSDKNADVQGPRLLGDVGIKKAIDIAMAERAEQSKIKAVEVLTELANAAFLDPATLFDSNGRLLDIHLIPESSRRAIASIETRIEGGNREGSEPELITKIKLVDKVRSLELLGRHLSMFVDRVKHEGAAFSLVVHGPDKK